MKPGERMNAPRRRGSGIKLIIILLCCLTVIHCSSQMTLQSNSVVKNQSLTVILKGGQKVTGEVKDIDAQQLVIIDRKGKTWTADRSNITRISGPVSAFDHRGQVISENEITLKKTNHNFWLFTISGGVLSAGCSFFISSMLSRAGNHNRGSIMTIGTATGTVLGGYAFARLGAAKDRQIAIDKISVMRNTLDVYQKDELERIDQIERELQQLKRERQKQQAEIDSLSQKVKNN